LDQLFRRPAALHPFVTALAEKIANHRVELVCGPLSGGAFLAQLIAGELGCEFAFAERIVSNRPGLFPVDYRVAASLREAVYGKRAAIVDDAISAGSAARATLADLEACGARPVALAAFILIGDRAAVLAREKAVPLEWLVQLPNRLYAPAECPMCALGAPLTEP
jgi:orotate phosphoribosyltransferase